MTLTQAEVIIEAQLQSNVSEPKELPLKPSNLDLRIQNIKDLYEIQTIIREEEDRNLSIDAVLARVLSLYRVHVPFSKSKKPEKTVIEESTKINLII